jgi:hypothetical protein
VRIGVQPQELKDGKPVEEFWFDEDRLEEIDLPPEKKSSKTKTTGGPNRESKIKVIEG